MGVLTTQQQVQAEAEAAWNIALEFKRNFVRSTPHGDVEIVPRDVPNWTKPDGTRREVPVRVQIAPPELPQRLTDTVRVIGGWKKLVNMTDVDFPFIQKSFYQHYLNWEASQQVVAMHLDGQARKLLDQMTMDPEKKPTPRLKG